MGEPTIARVLVIGAGEIGTAVGEALLRRLAPTHLAVHTSRPQTLRRRLDHLRSLAGERTELDGSWGDIFSPAALAQVGVDNLTDEHRWQLARYYCQPSAQEARPDSSHIYQVVQRHRPDVIIDAVTSATSGPRNVLPPASRDELLRAAAAGEARTGATTRRAMLDAVLGNPVPALSRYVANLDAALTDFGVKRYVKVSTSGLGGMGFACPYTHGATSNGFAAEALLGKIGAAGVLHQLLWNLHHTRGRDVRLVVPLALVGWEDVRYGAYTSRGHRVTVRDCALVDMPSSPLPDHRVPAAPAQMVVVPAGDNSTYSRAEMALSTALGQFESVTREEVGHVVAEAALGSTRYDLLTALDGAAMHSSYQAAHIRSSLLRRMRALEQETGCPSVVSGNLGPGVATDLFELHVLVHAAGSLAAARHGDTDDLASRCASLVASDSYLRQQALSIGLGILLPDGRELHPISEHEARVTSADPVVRSPSGGATGYADYRPANIGRWQRALQAIDRSSDPLRHAFGVGDPEVEIGEILAFHYLLTGRARRLNHC
ncbi:hypothetical protein [Micromonospora okii]|uniref:hypothetical protein n=1 Tax=Micromonospora okii TaxID=1182970 RepID=UPI001E5C8057|nr:hypothetical protein [Micromonospora okii]